MYVKHFLKMLLGLLFMAALGVTGLVLADHYSKTSATTAVTGTTASTTAP